MNGAVVTPGDDKGYNTYCVYVKSVTLHNCLSSFFSPPLFGDNGYFRAKKYFIDHRAANTIQLFFAIKGHFSCLFFF